jgi:hypothetical protein
MQVAVVGLVGLVEQMALVGLVAAGQVLEVLMALPELQIGAVAVVQV